MASSLPIISKRVPRRMLRAQRVLEEATLGVRLLFAGTPSLAVPSLKKMTERHEVCAVLTQPDKGKGRGRRLEASPIKKEALAQGLPCLTPKRIDRETAERMAAWKPEVLVVVAYGKIFPESALSLFPCGGINMHPSLLPLYRGPSPLTAVILGGEKETGVTIQRMAKEVDSGDILLQESYPLTGRETTGSLSQRVAIEGACLLNRALEAVEKGAIVGRPQNHQKATYCSCITKEETEIDWSESAEILQRRIRAYSPRPGAYTVWKDERLRILKAFHKEGELERRSVPGEIVGVDKKSGILIKAGKGLVVVEELQLASRKVCDFRSFLNGVVHFEGTVLGRKGSS